MAPQRVERRPRGARKGELVESHAFYDMRHLARFILMGVYTGSRSTPIPRASIKAASERAYLDLEEGLYYRLPEDAEEADIKRSPTLRLSSRLLARLRRWERKGVIAKYVVEWQGRPSRSVKTAWAHAIVLSGITGGAMPHTLRHTAVTWLKQRGYSSFLVGDYVGMSEATVDGVYGHRDPAFQGEIAEGIG